MRIINSIIYMIAINVISTKGITTYSWYNCNVLSGHEYSTHNKLEVINTINNK